MAISNSHEIIKEICKFLFEPEERRLRQFLDSIIEKNRMMYVDRPHNGFTYQGKCYGTARSRFTVPVWVPLHIRMIPEMDQYLEEAVQAETDRHHISQVLFGLIQPCSSNQDLRDTLPNCLVNSLPQLKNYSRLGEVAFTIKDNVRAMRQFQKALPRIEFYATSGLLY